MTERTSASGALTPRILLVGNHTCGNRGDAAILRGLIVALERLAPDAVLVITSRYPTSSAHLLGRPVRQDLMKVQPGRSFLARRARAALPALMALATLPGMSELGRLLPGVARRAVKIAQTFDVVIQVGGSYFVDLYGNSQLEVAYAVLLARRPVLLLGHSMGPFGRLTNRLLVAQLLRSVAVAALREPVSREVLERAGLLTGRVRAGGDTAWLVPTHGDGSDTRPLPQLATDRPTIAISLRDLAPFDQRLGVVQSDYEVGFARLADRLIAEGYDVVAVASCTGIDGYDKDDRMPALRTRSLVRRPDRFHVVMDEIDDIQLGLLLRRCQLLVATRLHCAIIAMNFGTPAIALAYEHKSDGVMAQAGLARFAAPVRSVVDGTIVDLVAEALSDIDAVRDLVAAAVRGERERAMDMVRDALGPHLS